MKRAISMLGTLVLVGSLGGIASAFDGIVSKNELAPVTNYCHLTFPAIEPSTLNSDHPVLEDPKTGDLIDIYGPCDTDPLGKDQVLEQRLEANEGDPGDHQDSHD